jgi:sodium transport system permease protein
MPTQPQPAPPTNAAKVNWTHVGILYLREMRAAFRERTIVINSVLIPIFLYPLLLWIAFTGLTYISGQTEGARVRVAILDQARAHPGLGRAFEIDPGIQLVRIPEDRSRLARRIQQGQIDAVLELLPPTNRAAALPGNFQAQVTYDKSKPGSEAARDRIQSVLGRYRSSWLKREARLRGIDAAAWQVFTLSSRNVASSSDMGAFVLGLMLPVIFVVMVAVGCFYPAVDALAGERERNTWETLMSTAANRRSIVTAKYLYVVSLGGLAGALNLLAVLVTFKPILAPLFENSGRTLETTLPLSAIPVLAIGAVLLAGFVAAGMMIFASFARTFREGQAMITPFYLMILVPIVFLQVPGLKLSAATALLPVLNVTLMVREAIGGTLHWAPLVITLVASIVAILLALRLAAFILKFEDVVIGTFSGSFGRFFRQRVLKQ